MAGTQIALGWMWFASGQFLIPICVPFHTPRRGWRVKALKSLSFYPLDSAFGSTNEEPLGVMADLQRQGLIRHVGLSSVTDAQVTQGQGICEIVCVQNLYNFMDRSDESLVQRLAQHKTAYVAYFPLGGITPLQSATLSGVARQLGATPMQVALAWLLQHAPNILPIPGTSSLAHLRENLAAASLSLPVSVIEKLDAPQHA